MLSRRQSLIQTLQSNFALGVSDKRKRLHTCSFYSAILLCPAQQTKFLPLQKVFSCVKRPNPS